MPLLISEDDAKNRLTHPANLLVKHKLIGHCQSKNGGRPAGGLNLSVELKGLIGTLANQSTNKSVAKVFNMAPAQVGAYARGLDSSGNKPDPKLRKHLEANIEVVREKVIDKILKSVDSITDEKITEANYATLSKASSNLAGVFDRLGPKNDSLNGITQQNFVFFGVKPRDERDYQVIEVEAVTS